MQVAWLLWKLNITCKKLDPRWVRLNPHCSKMHLCQEASSTDSLYRGLQLLNYLSVENCSGIYRLSNMEDDTTQIRKFGMVKCRSSLLQLIQSYDMDQMELLVIFLLLTDSHAHKIN